MGHLSGSDVEEYLRGGGATSLDGGDDDDDDDFIDDDKVVVLMGDVDDLYPVLGVRDHAALVQPPNHARV